jgi:hypothetical protein
VTGVSAQAGAAMGKPIAAQSAAGRTGRTRIASRKNLTSEGRRAAVKTS